ncbi:MAG: SDR family oxidoreductase [Pseudomonas veronii]|nr:SDR family oxidoreductase [Pseudomonas veronii]
MPPEEFEGAFPKLFATNVQGYLLGAQASIEALRETRGSMIFTLSNSAFYAGGGGILYVTAKHALVGMIRQLAYELAPEIRVNGVAPGATNTPMKSLEGLNSRSVPLNQIPGFEAGAAQAVPLQRIAEPEDHTGHYVLLGLAGKFRPDHGELHPQAMAAGRSAVPVQPSRARPEPGRRLDN